MNLEIELVIECRTEREASALEEALFPDNSSVPKDQEFSETRKGRTLTYRISSQRAAGAISSAVGLLSDAKLFQDVWSATS